MEHGELELTAGHVTITERLLPTHQGPADVIALPSGSYCLRHAESTCRTGNIHSLTSRSYEWILQQPGIVVLVLQVKGSAARLQASNLVELQEISALKYQNCKSTAGQRSTRKKNPRFG